MKVLNVSTFDTRGGAAKAAYRLHHSLLSQNVHSQMLVQHKSSDDFTVLEPEGLFNRAVALCQPTLDTLPFRFYLERPQNQFSTSWQPTRKIIKKINSIKPDIVHLHWINKGLIHIEDMAKIEAPIVWSLHDMWPFSGGWHYDPPLAKNSMHKLDKSIEQRKQKTYSKISNLHLVAPSKWIEDCASKSTLLRNRTIKRLPNPLNTKIFKPIDKGVSRSLWNLPAAKKLVLFGAMGATSDPRKGFDLLNKAFQQIKRDDLELVIFGASTPKVPPDLGNKINYVGTLSDDVSLVSLYNSVDVMIVPSRQEAFGQTASEAMACGTPVVAFAQTGLLDIVDHKMNGYLAQPNDIQDLAAGIEWILDNDSYAELSINAREKAMREFDADALAKKFILYYEHILSSNIALTN